MEFWLPDVPGMQTEHPAQLALLLPDHRQPFRVLKTLFSCTSWPTSQTQALSATKSACALLTMDETVVSYLDSESTHAVFNLTHANYFSLKQIFDKRVVSQLA